MMLLFAGRSSAAEVKTDYDRNAHFAQYKTYSWERVQTRDPLMVDRIKSAVNGSLAAKGLTEVPTGGDLFIVAIEVTHNQQTLDTFYVVDLSDTASKKLVWRGSASDTLSDKSEKNIDNLDKGVVKMFKKFPPDPSKK
jgi:hypothetical protein